jgi:hypothetical protein
MSNRSKKVAERKAKEFREKGIVDIYDNPYHAVELNWKLDKDFRIITPSGKTKIPFNIFRLVYLKTDEIIKAISKEEQPDAQS